MSSPLLTTLLLLSGLFPTVSEPPPRWGSDGHTIVCEIAFLDLHANTRQRVLDLIEIDPEFNRFSDSCSWADAVRARAEEGDPAYQRFAHLYEAHFVNFPRGAASVDRSNCTRLIEGVRTPCILDAIDQFATTLRGRGAAATRLEALKFLAHFVADVHQPLHAGYLDDRGGNRFPVRLQNGGRRDLHAVWDTELIDMTGIAPRAYAAQLRQAIRPIDRTMWSNLDPLVWATESYAIVESGRLYDSFATEVNGLPAVDEEYLALHRLTLERRLMQAGFRLARVLERALGT